VENFDNGSIEMSLFNHCLGRRYTWYHANVEAMSRLNRMLVSENWCRALGEHPFGCFQEMCLIIALWFLNLEVGIAGQRDLGSLINGSKNFPLCKLWMRYREGTMCMGMGFVLKEKIKEVKVRVTE